jgi:hypothetical protein
MPKTLSGPSDVAASGPFDTAARLAFLDALDEWTPPPVPFDALMALLPVYAAWARLIDAVAQERGNSIVMLRQFGVLTPNREEPEGEALESSVDEWMMMFGFRDTWFRHVVRLTLTVRATGRAGGRKWFIPYAVPDPDPPPRRPGESTLAFVARLRKCLLAADRFKYGSGKYTTQQAAAWTFQSFRGVPFADIRAIVDEDAVRKSVRRFAARAGLTLPNTLADSLPTQRANVG